MTDYDRAGHTVVTYVGTAPATQMFPTGLSIGQRTAKDVANTDIAGFGNGTAQDATTDVRNNTISTLAADSAFFTSGAPGEGNANREAVIREIHVVTAATAADTVQLKDHANVKALTPAYPCVAGARWQFGEGIPIKGGFSMVGSNTGAGVFAIVWELKINKTGTVR